MTNQPSVTIGVPVYNGARYLEETLSSIQLQTYQNIQVYISVDGPQSDSEKICKPFLKDERFQMVVQPERLGWVGNLNWLMAQVNTPFWYCNPQDDLVDPVYVETLLAHAANIPKAAVVYCDISSFGQRTGNIIQTTVSGSALTRQLNMLLFHLPAVAFRGLTRVAALRHAGKIPENRIENFAVDTTWMAAMARWGDLIRVPSALYRKRYHSDNEHMKWLDWPVEKKTSAWINHCVDMLEQAMLINSSTQENRILWLAGVERLFSRRFGFLPKSDINSKEKISLYKAFIEYLVSSKRVNIPDLLEGDWAEIKRWTESVYWPSRDIW